MFDFDPNRLQFSILVFSTVMMSLVVLVYAFLAPWYRSFAGIVVFLVHVGYTVLLLALLLNALDVDNALRSTNRVLLYVLTPFTSTSLLIIVLRAQLHGRKGRTIEKTVFSKQVFETEPEYDSWDGNKDRRSTDRKA